MSDEFDVTDVAASLSEHPEPGTTADTTADDTTRAADDTGEQKPAPVPYERFREVNETKRKYEKLGRPDEVEARLAKLDQIERERADAERHAAEAERRKANPKMADAEDLITEVVQRKFPHLAENAEVIERERQMQIERHVQHGFEQIPQLLKENGVPVTPATVRSYEKMIESEIVSDPKLKAGFWRPMQQADAMKEAFTRVKSAVINPALQAQGAKTLDEARALRERTLGRATPSGTARLEPKKFESKHAPGSAGWEADRDAYRRSSIAAALDADLAEEVVAL